MSLRESKVKTITQTVQTLYSQDRWRRVNLVQEHEIKNVHQLGHNSFNMFSKLNLIPSVQRCLESHKFILNRLVTVRRNSEIIDPLAQKHGPRFSELFILMKQKSL